MAEPEIDAMELQDHEGWHLVYRQSAPFAWPKGRANLCEFDYLSDNFSKLGKLESFRRGGEGGDFTFQLRWPLSRRQPVTWIQRNNPLTEEGVEGYRPLKSKATCWQKFVGFFYAPSRSVRRLRAALRPQLSPSSRNRPALRKSPDPTKALMVRGSPEDGQGQYFAIGHRLLVTEQPLTCCGWICQMCCGTKRKAEAAEEAAAPVHPVEPGPAAAAASAPARDGVIVREGVVYKRKGFAGFLLKEHTMRLMAEQPRPQHHMVVTAQGGKRRPSAMRVEREMWIEYTEAGSDEPATIVECSDLLGVRVADESRLEFSFTSSQGAVRMRAPSYRDFNEWLSVLFAAWRDDAHDELQWMSHRSSTASTASSTAELPRGLTMFGAHHQAASEAGRAGSLPDVAEEEGPGARRGQQWPSAVLPPRSAPKPSPLLHAPLAPSLLVSGASALAAVLHRLPRRRLGSPHSRGDARRSAPADRGGGGKGPSL